MFRVPGREEVRLISAEELSAQSLISRLHRQLASICNNDRSIGLGLFLLCIVTRIMAIPASLWEWDDILFARALHKYDITVHSPHPPGFPVFVVMARFLYWITGDEHSALTALAFIFASFVAPALFYFYRAILLDRRIAFAGALLGSFAPNVWVHGGAGRSDGVAFTLGIIGLTLVIRGFQSQRSLIAGCAVFGLSMGVRTTLLPVMGPIIAVVFIDRLRRHEWRDVAAALAAGTLCVIVWYVPMVYYVTWTKYNAAVTRHSHGIYEGDALFTHMQTLSVVLYRVQRFFVDVWGTKWIMQIIYGFSALGLSALAIERQWRTISLMLVAFLPYLIFTFVLNAPVGGPLYSLPYIPFFTGLAACGLILPARWLFHSGRWTILENSGLLLATCLTLAVAAWAYPAVNLLHREVSPPVRALDYLKKSLDPEKDLLSFSGVFSPYVSFYLPNYKVMLREEDLDPEYNLIGSSTDRHILTLTSNPLLEAQGKHFLWTTSELGARRLSRMSLERYFSAHIADTSKLRGVAFLSGWYTAEGDQTEVWRWMSRQGNVAIYSLAESMILRLRGSIVYPPAPDRRPTIIFRLGGKEIDRITIDRPDFDHQLLIKPDPGIAWSILSLEIDQTVIASARANGRKTDVLGFKCFELGLSAAAGAPLVKTSPDQYLGAGWSELDYNSELYWRWINGSSITYLPAIEGDGRLDLMLKVPDEINGSNREITVEGGGIVLDKFRPPNGFSTKSIAVPQSLHRGTKLELKLSLPVGDSKTPEIQIFYLGFRPSEKN
jgi:hypothetical protein